MVDRGQGARAARPLPIGPATLLLPSILRRVSFRSGSPARPANLRSRSRDGPGSWPPPSISPPRSSPRTLPRKGGRRHQDGRGLAQCHGRIDLVGQNLQSQTAAAVSRLVATSDDARRTVISSVEMTIDKARASFVDKLRELGREFTDEMYRRQSQGRRRDGGRHQRLVDADP